MLPILSLALAAMYSPPGRYACRCVQGFASWPSLVRGLPLLASRVRWVHAAGLVVPVVSALRLSRAGRCSVVVSAAGGWGCTRSLIRPSAVYRFSHWRTRSARSCVPGPSPHTVSTSIHASPAPHSYYYYRIYVRYYYLATLEISV